MSFKVQHQIRQNATDIRSYLDDLYAWEDQMNQPQGNKKPTKSSTNPKQNKENFPIRGQALEEEEEQVIEETNANDKGETTAINANLKKEHTTSTQYYDAWAKHAKQLEQDLEKEEIEAKKIADKKPQQPVNPMQRTSGAEKNTKIVIKGGRSSYNEVESLKEKGNLYFKSNELDKAVALYTEALEKGLVQQVNDELLVVLYSNRAMTYLKLREYLKAEEDCNCALKLNEKHVKSLVRRGNARKRLEKFKAALKDFEKAAEVEPENKEIQEEIRLVKKKLETIKEEQKKKMLLPMSITQKPKVSVKVEDYDPDTAPEVLETQKPAVKASTGVENRDISSTVTGASSATGEVTSEFLGLKDVEGKLVKHDEVEEAAVESAKQKVHFRLDLNVQEKNKGHLEPVDLSKKPKKSGMKRKNQPVPEEEKSKKKEAKITEDKISKAVEHGKELWQKKIEEDFKKSSSTTTNEKAAEEASKVSRIENSSEFLNYWKHIRDNEETCEKFLLSQARPERFAEIFAAGVDFDLYMELIKFGLKIVERNSELPLGILEGLGKVKRFDINVKSMLSSEKKVIKEILDKATKSAERASPERLDDITKKYKL